jgi:hypothetical protein
MDFLVHTKMGFTARGLDERRLLRNAQLAGVVSKGSKANVGALPPRYL